MSEIPHSDKMFHLPIEVSVYVPSTQDVDKVVSKSEMKLRVDEVKKYLASLFGGFSSSTVEGGFLASDGKVVKENVERVVSFAPKEDFEKNKEALVQKASEWATKWGQEAIGLEHEGDLYYVPQKFENGGTVAIREAKEMANSQAIKIKHHVSELSNLLKSNPTIEAWVIAKLESASNDLADVTHYLDGRVQMSGKKMAKGGDVGEKMIKVKVDYLEQQYFQLEKEMEIPFSVFKEYDKTGKVPRELINDLISETTLAHHVETNPISVRLTPVVSNKMATGGQTQAQQNKIAKVMGEFKDRKLHSSSGDLVTDRKQAIAIALSEAGIEKKMAKGGRLNDNIPSTEDLIELVASEREKKINEWRKYEKVVIGRNDGYSWEDGTTNDNREVATKPSRAKILEIIKNNPSVTEIRFYGTIKVGQRVGQELEIVDGFDVVLWSKEDTLFKKGFQFRSDNGKYFNTIIDKSETVEYKNRKDNGEFIYYQSIDKYGNVGQGRIHKEVLQEDLESGDAVEIKKMADGGGIQTFKQKQLAELKLWKKSKLEDLKSVSKSIGITSNNNSYLSSLERLDKLVDACEKVIKSGILKDGKYFYIKEFIVDSYRGNLQTQASLRFDKFLITEDKNFEKDWAEQKQKFPYADMNSFIAQKVGELTKKILGYSISSSISYSIASSSIGGTFAEGGSIDPNAMEVQFIKYKGEEIMYEPHFKEFYVNDSMFNTLEEAKYFIDKGAPMSEEIKLAYRRGLFAKGGNMEFKRPSYKSSYVASQDQARKAQAEADLIKDENWNKDYENDPLIKGQKKAKETAIRAGMAYATSGASEVGRLEGQAMQQAISKGETPSPEVSAFPEHEINPELANVVAKNPQLVQMLSGLGGAKGM